MDKLVSTKQQRRILGYDFARSLAILGMIIVNFKISMNADTNGPQYLITFLNFIEGKAAATFIVLAGVGVSLMTKNWNEINKWDLRRKLMKRSMLLLILGLAFMSIWPADILHFYAFYMIIAAFMFTMNSQTLLKWAATFVVSFLLLLIIIDYNTGWDFDNLTYTDFWTINGMLRSIFYNGFHSVFPWTTFLIVGMWLGRKNIQEVSTQTEILQKGIILTITSTFISFIGKSTFDFEDANYVFGTQPLPPFPLFIMTGIGTAFIIIVISFKITIRWSETSFVTWMVETGQLALTNYIAHVAIGLGFLEAVGLLSIDNGLSLWFALGYSMFFYFVLIIYSHIWKKHYINGPLEGIMRRLSN